MASIASLLLCAESMQAAFARLGTENGKCIGCDMRNQSRVHPQQLVRSQHPVRIGTAVAGAMLSVAVQ